MSIYERRLKIAGTVAYRVGYRGHAHASFTAKFVPTLALYVAKCPTRRRCASVCGFTTGVIRIMRTVKQSRNENVAISTVSVGSSAAETAPEPEIDRPTDGQKDGPAAGKTNSAGMSSASFGLWNIERSPNSSSGKSIFRAN